MSEEHLLTAFSRLRLSLHHMALRFLPNRDDAEDILQEAFCRLWPHHEEIGSEQEAAALTTTTVRHLCIDETRKRGRYTTEDIEEHTNRLSGQSPQEEMERKERLELLDRAIAQRLTPMQREILHLKEFEDYTTEEIADRLHLQPTAVRMHLSRARKAIREQYKEWNP